MTARAAARLLRRGERRCLGRGVPGAGLRVPDDAGFHEIGHVLRHGKTDVWIEASSSGASDPREAEADKFSRDVLIPPRDAGELPRLKSADQVRRFAERLGVAPDIVVGRLQHDGFWSHSQGNQLKRQLSLSATGDDSLPLTSP